MKTFSISFGLGAIYDHRDLLTSIVKREIENKYRASLLGKLWLLIYPLMMLATYTWVFSGVFGTRWGEHGDLIDYVPMLYCGMLVYAIFAETISKAPNLVVNNPNYVKKIIFPLELLPVGTLFVSLFNAAIGFSLLLIMILLIKHGLNWTIIFLPVVLVPLIIMTLGIAWMISALGVFFRDIEQFIGVLMSMLLFLSPVFYSVNAAPLTAQKFLALNPLSYPIEEVRNVVLMGRVPNWELWLLSLLFAIAIAFFGLWFFERTRPAFADVV